MLDKEARTQEIISAFLKGDSMSAIGERHDLSRQRVYQILKREGYSRTDGGITVTAAKNRLKVEERREDREQERNDAMLKLHGITLDEYRRLKRTRPFEDYREQRRNASSKGVGWKLVYPEWLKLWEDSGHLRERGPGNGYGLSRIRHDGDFELGNVIVRRNSESSSIFIRKMWREKRED